MVPDKIKWAEQLTRKDTVAPEHSTTKRDQAADWIEEHVIRADRWSEVTMTQMADESGWSRQHIANTLEHYFEPADPDSGHSLTIDGIDIQMLLDVYREGYRAGLEDGRKGEHNPKTEDELIRDLR